jgi:hypothetical protein
MNVTFLTGAHYQVRQCEFSTHSETVAVSASPHIEAIHTPHPGAPKAALFAPYVGYLN